jgi:hypothetical protein
MFPDSSYQRKKQRRDDSIGPLQIILLSVLVLTFGLVLGGGLMVLRNIDTILAKANPPPPSSTPGPTNTPTPAPTGTAMPDFSGLVMDIWELPLGYTALSEEEVTNLLEGGSLGNAIGVPINSQFGYRFTDSAGNSINLLGYTFILPSADNQKKYDEYIQSENLPFEQILAQSSVLSKKERPEQEFSQKVAETYAYWRFLRDAELETQNLELLAFRRRAVGTVLVVISPHSMPTYLDLLAVGQGFDKQIIQAIKTGYVVSEPINPDDIRQTLIKAEKRFEMTEYFNYQIDSWHSPNGGSTSITGITMQPEAMTIKRVIGSQEWVLNIDGPENWPALETNLYNKATGKNVLTFINVDIDEINQAVYALAKNATTISTLGLNLTRTKDEVVDSVSCFVYSTEIRIALSDIETMDTLFMADAKKIYTYQGPIVTIWLDQASLGLKKAHFIFPYLDEDQSPAGNMEVDMFFSYIR